MGALNAIYFLPLMLTNNNRNNLDSIAQDKWFPTLKEFLKMLLTFCLTLLAWIFFRSNTVGDAFGYIKNIFNRSLFEMPSLSEDAQITLVLVLFFVVIEWIGKEGEYAISKMYKLPLVIRWSFYFVLLILMFVFTGEEQAFIYFQF